MTLRASVLVALQLLAAAPVALSLDAGLVSQPLESGKPVTAATWHDDASEHSTGGLVLPLSAGKQTIPLGAAFVFGSSHADLFIANTPDSSSPGLFLYEFLQLDERGVPQFRYRQQLTHPFKGLIPPVGTIAQDGEVIHGIWHVEDDIYAHTVFDAHAMGFTNRRELHLTGIGHPPVGMALLHGHGSPGGQLVIHTYDRAVGSTAAPKETLPKAGAAAADTAAAASGGSQAKPAAGLRSTYGYTAPFYNPRDGEPDYFPRDQAGYWRGPVFYSSLFSAHLRSLESVGAHRVEKVNNYLHDMQLGYSGLASYSFNNSGLLEKMLIVSSAHGGLYAIPATDGGRFLARSPLLDAQDHTLQHPHGWPVPLAYPSRDGQLHLMVGGAGPLQFYRLDRTGADGMDGAVELRLQPGLPVSLAAGAELQTGAHAMLSVADWDADGRPDLLAGNADGRLLLCRNAGTARQPAFLPAISVSAVGGPVHIQPGYRALHGPAESRFGYACPAAADWNGDGLPDVVMHDGLGRHHLYTNIGQPKQPLLAAPQALLHDGLELRGPWRVRPGVARMGAKTVLVTLDEANDFHVYYRLDAGNLKDGGKMKLRSGRPVKSGPLMGGAGGQLSIDVVDFDGDGTLDLLLAAPRHAAIPDADTGLPATAGLAHAVVLFMKGRVEEVGRFPRMKYPEVVYHNGHPLVPGKTGGSVVAAWLGPKPGPHLLVGQDDGTIRFYERARLSCESYNRFPNGELMPQTNSAPLTREEYDRDAAAGSEGSDAVATTQPECGCREAPAARSGVGVGNAPQGSVAYRLADAWEVAAASVSSLGVHPCYLLGLAAVLAAVTLARLLPRAQRHATPWWYSPRSAAWLRSPKSARSVV